MSESRPYDLTQLSEITRLFHEISGYLKICRNCGTDFNGRGYAIEALKSLIEEEEEKENL